MTFDMARKCKREGRKTISTEDLLQSLQFLGNHMILSQVTCFSIITTLYSASATIQRFVQVAEGHLVIDLRSF
jgi:hypothetical protein